jgi:hypothetical protein
MEKKQVTSDDLTGMEGSLSKADLVRILRSCMERAERLGTQETCQLLLEVLLNDSLGMQVRRDELVQEIGTCTPNELAVMRTALLKARTPVEEKP